MMIPWLKIFQIWQRKLKQNAPNQARISIDSAIEECSETLMLLLAAISPKLASVMPAAVIGNIVTML